jgi:uncharacterized membrane protein HdeD (DUF308 family)
LETVRFWVGTNKLFGTLPSSFASWSRLDHFNVGHNSLSGTLPPAFSLWTNVSEVYAGGNSLNGTIPDSYGAWTKIIRFWVGTNNLFGTLPSSFASWSRLEVFDVGHNSLSGTLPPEFSLWTNVSEVYAGGNSLNGTIPDSYGAWTKIIRFWVGTNNLFGTLPSSFASWSRLEVFDVGFNSLSGTLPPEFSSWTNVSAVFFQANAFAGTIPASYGAWRRISQFRISNNDVVGPLSETFAAWEAVSSVHMQSNRLNGSLPLFVGTSWRKLRSFVVSDNQFTGTIPSVYSLLGATLKSLLLNCNRLSGTLPSSFQNLSALENFAVGGNRELSGPLPPSWGALRLAGLVLQNTSLSGPVPSTWSSTITPGGAVSLCNTDVCGGPGVLSPMSLCGDDEGLCSSESSQSYILAHSTLFLLTLLPPCSTVARLTVAPGRHVSHSMTQVFESLFVLTPSSVSIGTLQITRTFLSSAVGVATGASSGALSISRAAAVSRLTECISSGDDNGGGGSDVNEGLVVIGRLVLGASLALCGCFVVLLLWRGRHTSVAHAAEVLHLPGRAWTALSGIVPLHVELGLTILSATNVDESTTSGELFLGVALLMVGVLSLMWQWSVVSWRFRASWNPTRHVVSKAHRTKHGGLLRCVRRLMTEYNRLRSEGTWRDVTERNERRPPQRRPLSFVATCGPVFDACTHRRAWFVAWESGLAAGSSLLAVFSSGDGGGNASCTALQILGAVLQISGLVVLAAARPHREARDWIVAMILELLGFAGGVCLLMSALLTADVVWSDVASVVLQAQFYVAAAALLADGVFSGKLINVLRQLFIVKVTPSTVVLQPVDKQLLVSGARRITKKKSLHISSIVPQQNTAMDEEALATLVQVICASRCGSM